MQIKEFIEKAIEGGYLTQHHKDIMLSDAWEKEIINELLLDPKSWEAVGEVEGWDRDYKMNVGKLIEKKMYSADYYLKEGYRYKMNGLMPHLQEGGNIESYIEKL